MIELLATDSEDDYCRNVLNEPSTFYSLTKTICAEACDSLQRDSYETAGRNPEAFLPTSKPTLIMSKGRSVLTSARGEDERTKTLVGGYVRIASNESCRRVSSILTMPCVSSDGIVHMT